MRRHRIDVTALVIGLVFAFAVAAWFAYDNGLLDLHELTLGAPVGLIVLGAVGITASLTRTRRESPATGATTTTGPTSEEPG